MRVIAGTYKSRILKSLKGLALRPTSDRLRETLFNVLAPNIAGSRFVDLFAGTGAIGIEALSRGAAEVVFIENHAPAVTLIRRNLDSLGINTGATVLTVDTLRGLAMTLSITNLGWGILEIALPVLVLSRLHQGPATVGLLWGGLGAAGLVSALIAGRVKTFGRERQIMLGGIIVSVLAFASLPFATSVPAVTTST